MSDSLLISIRQGILEGRPLPDLLRACVFLGTDTGSEALRRWATYELDGYPSDAAFPDYRVCSPVPLRASYRNGPQIMSKISMAPWNFPPKAREHYPEEIRFKQTISELIQFSQQELSQFQMGQLLIMKDLFNVHHYPGAEIFSISADFDASFFVGLIDRVRNSLTSMIADMTSGHPVQELPPGDVVDRVVMKQIQNNYETSIQQPAGPVAVGSGATANQSGVTVDELLKLLGELKGYRELLKEDQQSEAVSLASDIEASIHGKQLDEVKVGSFLERLQSLAGAAGMTGLTAVVGGIAEKLTELATTGF